MTISGQMILDALMNDPAYTAWPKAQLEVNEPYVLNMPEILKDLLDKPVSVENVLAAQIRFLDYRIKNGWGKKMLEATGVLPPKEVKLFTGLLENAVKQMEKLYKKVPERLARKGVNEEQVMADPQGGYGLQPEVMKLYHEGTLTIEKLLLMQPYVIIKTSK